MTGLEPATSATTTRRSNQLSYIYRLGPTVRRPVDIIPNSRGRVNRPFGTVQEFGIPHTQSRGLFNLQP